MQQRNQINAVIGEKIKPAIDAVERRIAGITNLSNQHIDKLKNYFEDTYKAYEWINQNRHQFQGQIFNPVMIEVALKDKKNAKYLENTIANKDLQSFVCTNKADMTALLKKLRNEMKLQVNVGFSEAANELEYSPNVPIEELRKYGFHSYLIDMIEGPAPILNMLCRLYSIHNIAVGNDQTFKEAAKVPDSIRKFFSSKFLINCKDSKFNLFLLFKPTIGSMSKFPSTPTASPPTPLKFESRILWMLPLIWNCWPKRNKIWTNWRLKWIRREIRGHKSRLRWKISKRSFKTAKRNCEWLMSKFVLCGSIRRKYARRKWR